MAGTSYTRQSTLSDGNIITAALFNNEFNQLLNAFVYASSGTQGHCHDGSAGQGGAISKIGDQDFKNKIQVNDSINRWDFYVENGSGVSTLSMRVTGTGLSGATNNSFSLGAPAVKMAEVYSVDGDFETLTVEDLTLTGAAANVVWDSSENTLEFADATYAAFGASDDLLIYHDGSNSYIKETGTGNLFIQGDTNINIGSANASASLQVSSTGTVFQGANSLVATLTTTGMKFEDSKIISCGSSDDLQIYHDGNNSVIKDAGTGNLNIYASTDVFIGTTSSSMANFDSAGAVDLYHNNSKKFETTSAGATITGAATVTGAVGAQTFNASSSIDTPIIEVTTLKARDGSAAGSIADSTGVVTLASSVLTTADINGGTADNVVIGGSTAAAGTFTTINGTTSNVTTSNATTVDTTNIEVTNLKAKDGTSAGSIADSTGVVTLGSSVLTTADINGGTVDNVVIGGSTAAAGTFTTGTIATADINGGAIDGTTIGGSTAAAGTFTTGTIATADINGGAIDGTVIGGSSAAAGNFTSLGATGTVDCADLTMTDSSPTITINDSDGTDTFGRVRQVTGTLKFESRNNTTHGAIELETSNDSVTKTRLKVGTNGDINFYADDGTTVGAKWDASASKMGIGLNSPTEALDVVGSIKTTTGIVFVDADSDGTATSNTLDAYEEGTWEPAVRDAETEGNTATLGAATGHYTLIGNQCTLVARIIDIDPGNEETSGSPTGGNTIYITGLPFAPANLPTSVRHVGSMESTNITYQNSIQPRILENASYIVISNSQNNGSLSTLVFNSINTSAADIFLQITYTV